MITFTFRRFGISARGHAEFAQAGSDIVCAAFSAVFLAGLMCFKENEISISQNAGQTSFSINKDFRNEVNLTTLKIVKKQIKIIARFYPQSVKIIQK